MNAVAQLLISWVVGSLLLVALIAIAHRPHH